VPCGFVVKNCSKSRRPTSGWIPGPLSLTVISTASSTRRVATVRAPVWASDSRPFLIRFSTAWRRSVRSIAIGGRLRSVFTSTTMPCRWARGRMNSARPTTISLIESSSKWGRGKRANARYSSVSASRVFTWSRMAPTSDEASSISDPGRSRTMSPSISAFSSIAAIGLRTSWATFSARRPTVAIRSATRSSSCAAWSRVSVPISSVLSRSTSARVQPTHGGASAAAAA